MTRETLAHKYPFLPSARSALEGRAPEARTWEHAAQAILRATENQPDSVRDDVDFLLEHAAARAVLAALSDSSVTRKWAAARADAFTRALQAEPTAVQEAVERELLPSLRSEPDGLWTVSVLDYARWGTDLALADVQDGRVWLDAEKERALARRSLEGRLSANLHRLAANLPPEAHAAAQAVRDGLPQFTPVLTGDPATDAKENYLARACIQTIRKGVGEGKRWYGAMAVSKALKHDGVPLEAAKQAIREYATASSTPSSPFTEREALATLEWVYKREGRPRIFCQDLVTQGLIPDLCPNCPYRKRRKGAAKP